MVTQFRGLPVYDGGFAAQQPCPPGVKLCVRISSSNPQWVKRSSVETFMARLLARGPVAIMKPDPTIRSYPPITPTGSDGPDPELVKLAASKGVDIAPGVFLDGQFVGMFSCNSAQQVCRVVHGRGLSSNAFRPGIRHRVKLHLVSMAAAVQGNAGVLLLHQSHCVLPPATLALPAAALFLDAQVSTTSCHSPSRSGTSMPSHPLMMAHCTSCTSWVKQMQLHGQSMQA